MRRIAALTVGIALTMTMTVGVGLAVSEFYLDSFDSGNYSGSQGTVAWPGPWVEIGESDGATAGKVKITSSGCSGPCLLINWGVVSLVDTGARRPVDLSSYSAASLSYELDVELAALPLTTAVLRVEALDGSIWRTIKTHVLATSEGTQTANASMNIVAGQSSAVRFVVSGILDGSVRIDDVRIDLTPVATTTTSTTSTTTVTLPPTTLPTIPTVTSTTLPGGSGLPTGSTTTSTIPGQTTTSSTIDTSGGGSSSGGGTPPSSGSGDEGGTPTVQADGGTSAPAGGPDGRLVVAPIALDVRSGNPTGQIDILDADYSADFSLAAEVFDLLGAGPLVLAGVISALALVGIDRRRAPIALSWRRSDNDS